MPRNITPTQATDIIEAHKELTVKLNKISAIEQELIDEVQKSANQIITSETLEILREIPIEEINRDKKGLRVKALRDSGYNTVADVAVASLYSLESIHGISHEAAQAIKDATAEIISTTRKNIKVKLSADDKSPAASRVVLAVSKYKQAAPFIYESQELQEDYSLSIEKHISALAPAVNGIKWFFTSEAKKRVTLEAYDALSGMLNGRYAKTITNNLRSINKILHISGNDAWKDFSEDSIRFFNILENLIPGLSDSDDTLYGLPEELARDIQEQTYFPDGLLCELRRYQEWGVKYILHQEKVLLGDEMGLGKTVQAIAAMVSLRNTGATHFFVICPASVLSNWCREIRKMSKLSVTKIHGSDRRAALEAWLRSGGVAVTTFETTASLELEDDFSFSMLVVDEAHYIKNPFAKRTASVAAIASHAERLLYMTGTALENKVDEMISLIKQLQPEVAAKVRGMEFLATAPQFRDAIAPVYYRRKREDVLKELPELIESQEWCTMNPAEEEIYEEAVLGDNLALARRVSWNINDLNESSKAKRLLEIIENAKEEGRKVIVFSYFLDTVGKVTDLLGANCCGTIVGSVSPSRRQSIIDNFDSAPEGSVLVAQIQAGGTGLNIQSASVVVLCEPQFKPSIENQAISRAYRMGQTRNVLVFRLLCEESIDEKITELLESKQQVFDAFADESVAAKHHEGLDDKTVGDLIKSEIDRINAKRATQDNATQTEDSDSTADSETDSMPEADEETEKDITADAEEDNEADVQSFTHAAEDSDAKMESDNNFDEESGADSYAATAAASEEAEAVSDAQKHNEFELASDNEEKGVA